MELISPTYSMSEIKPRQVVLESVGVSLSKLPEGNLPEVALVGRSNVGKSSLVNALSGRKSLARTSQTPGKTRTINIYRVDDRLRLVDLPGYGYAKAPKGESEKWGSFIETYLKKRDNLKAVIVLLDIRHEPSALDLTMIDWLDHFEKDILAVATKADKLNRSQISKHLSMISRSTGLILPPIAVSAKEKTGIENLWKIIEDFCGLNPQTNGLEQS